MFKAQVKFIEKVLVEYNNSSLPQLLINLESWRENKSNKKQDYDLYITDEDGIRIFGSRF